MYSDKEAGIAADAEPKTELERLREEVTFLKTCGIVELAIRNQSVADYMRHWENRTEKAEASVVHLRAKALEDEALWVQAAKDAEAGNWWLLREFIKLAEPGWSSELPPA